MAFYFIDYTIHIDLYGKQACALVEANSEQEAAKMALGDECHGDPKYIEGGYQCIDSVNDFIYFVYEVTGVKIVPEHELKILDKYVFLTK
ncbi:MAG: hypothetical protein ACUZ8E_11970 [Candidatus Anammoxibacter sp.]